MISRYSATLAIVVILITYALSLLRFATRSQVVSGETVREDLKFEFTLDADPDHPYRVNPDLKQFLEDHINFYGEGAAHVISSKVEITSKDVSWTQNHTNYTFTGAGMAAQVQWDTPDDSQSGEHGIVYLDFPVIPNLGPSTTTFHSGGYQRDSADRYVVREVTTYRTGFQVAAARFVFALAAGLPFGVLLHTIGWAFVLKGEKRSRIEAFPPQSTGLPQTFYPNPIAEWSTWLYALGLGDIVSTIFAGVSLGDGFISSDARVGIYGVLAVAVVVAATCVAVVRWRVLTVCLAAQGIAYARGRKDLKWLNAAWTDIVSVTEKSRTYRGNTKYWIEVKFADKRGKLKIEHSIMGYFALRDTLLSLYTAAKQVDHRIPDANLYRGLAVLLARRVMQSRHGTLEMPKARRCSASLG